jgi:hypothetical protein
MNNQSLMELLAKAPKQFCDNVNGGFSNESFLLALFSGQNATVFTFTPAHMKKFSQWARHQVDTFEKQYGEIKAEWNPNVPSPIQAKDLKNPPEDDKEEN